ncbi:MAG: potassium transporter TrkA [Methanomassiliicoccales archaeon]|nr:potassium transporter TrkA [Methanomassiliicoccales archaeon]NYT14725.1 potassium transporter TrkA [Methanomassiliicoccales archaeon]
MKDISEVIVDLAYAALMFDSKEIGEEVKHLESTMDTLNYEIRIKAMLASRTPDDAIQLSGLLQVASAAEAISNAAGDVVDLLSTEIEKRPFLTFILRDAEEKIRMLILSDRSDMVSRTIEDLSVESETGMRIIAIKRGKRWIYDPEDETKLKGGDLLIVRGTEDGFETLRRYTSAKEKWPAEEEGS